MVLLPRRRGLWWPLFTLAVTTQALYEEYEEVREFASVAEFEREVMADDATAWLFSLYAKEGCESCDKIEPEVAGVAAELGVSLGVKTAAVDVTTEEGRKIGKRLGAFDRVPAILGVASDTELNPYTKKPGRTVVPWLDMFKDNSFSTGALKRWFAAKVLPSDLVRRGSDALHAARKSELPVAVLVTERQTTSALAKSLALALRGRLSLVELSTDDALLLSESLSTEDTKSITKSMLVDDATKEVYAGSLKDRAAVLAWLQARALATKKISKDESSHPRGGEEEEKIEDDSPPSLFGSSYAAPVVESAEDLASRLQREEAAVIVSPFFSGEAAKTSDAVLAVAKKLGELDGSGTVKAYVCAYASSESEESSSQKSKWRAYGFGNSALLGEFDDASEAFAAAAESVPTGPAAVIGALQMEQFIQQSLTAADPPPTGVVVFSTKDDVSIHVKALAKVLEATTGVPVAQVVVDQTVDKELMQRFGIQKAPGVFAFHQQKGEAPAGAVSLGLAHYDRRAFGPPTFRTLVTFVGMLLQELDQDAASSLQDAVLEDAASRKATPSTTKRRRPGDLADLNALGVQRGCDQQLCAVFLLDGTGSSEDVSVAREVAQAEASGPYSFGWLDATCHSDFAVAAFDVDASKLPTLVAYAPRKDRFAAYVGHFNAKDLKSFLRGVLSGRTATAPSRSPGASVQTARDCTALASDESADATDDAAAADDDGGLDTDLMAEILAEEAAKKKALDEEVKAERRRLQEEERARKQAELDEKNKAKTTTTKKKKKKKKKASSSDL